MEVCDYYYDTPKFVESKSDTFCAEMRFGYESINLTEKEVERIKKDLENMKKDMKWKKLFSRFS